MGNCLLIFYKRDLENQDKDHVWPSIEGFYWLGTNSGLIKSWKSSQGKGLSCQWLKIIPPKSTGYFLTWLKSEEKNWMSLWIWEMRALLLAGGSDLPRLLILSRSVGTLVARLGRREARRMQRETRGPDCAKSRKRTKCRGNFVKRLKTSPMLLHLQTSQG